MHALANAIPHEDLAVFCRRHGVVRLSLFGSILREDFGPHSDIDMLVEFAPDVEPSLLDLGGMQHELCDMFGRQVDLKTPDFLSPFVRERVKHEAQLQYAA